MQNIFGLLIFFLKWFVYLVLILWLTDVLDIYVRAQTCTMIQKCSYCKIYDSDCRSEKEDLDEATCKATHLSLNQIVEIRSWESEPCRHSSCDSPVIVQDSGGSVSFRMVECYSGCTDITVTRTKYRVVINATPNKTMACSSDNECEAYCINKAFEGFNLTCHYDKDTDVCNVYTDCPNLGVCETRGSLSDKKRVYTILCDHALTTCGVLASPGNGSVTTTGFLPGGTASYSCDTGYTLDNTGTRTCGNNGTWDGTQPTCTPVNCSTPWQLTNGTVTVSDTTYLNLASYQCDTGFILTGSNVSVCQNDSTWSGTQPQCDMVDCGTPSPITNGSFTVMSSLYQGTTNHSCDLGYEVSGPSTRTCQADGTWNGTDPSCVPVDCGDPDDVPNAVATFTTTDKDSVAVYECDPRCSIIGDNETQCLPSDNWSLPAPSCDCPQCSSLSDPLNGAVAKTNGNQMGSVATYSCNNGYKLSGPKQRTCLPAGQWTATTPTCQYVPLVYLMACLCNTNPVFTDMTEEEIIDQLIQETAIDTEATGAAEQKLICMKDSRTSSTLIGTAGVIFISVIFGSFVLLDCLTLFGERCETKKDVYQSEPRPKQLTALEHYLTS